jgi:hypothetical protein
LLKKNVCLKMYRLRAVLKTFKNHLNRVSVYWRPTCTLLM